MAFLEVRRVRIGYDGALLGSHWNVYQIIL